jgi:hypothetical protein
VSNVQWMRGRRDLKVDGDDGRKSGLGCVAHAAVPCKECVSRINFTEYLILRDLGNAFAEAEREPWVSSVVIEYMLGTA